MKNKSERKSGKTRDSLLAEQISSFLENSADISLTEDAADLIYGLERLGRTLNQDEDKDRAVQHFTLAVDNLRRLTEAQDDLSLEISLCESCGQTYLLLGAWNRARDNYHQGIRLSQQSGDHRSQARLLRRLANLETKQNHEHEALKLLNESLELSKEHGELRDEASVLNGMAIVYFQLSDWRKMRRVCDRALVIAEDLNDTKLIGSIYNNLGAMHSVRGQWDHAFSAFQKSLPQFELIGDDRGLAETYNNMGTLYRDKEIWGRSGECYARSIALAQKIGDAFVKASAMLNRVELYILMHDLDMAEATCKKTLKVFHDLDNEQGVADACKIFGVIYTKKRSLKLAENYFREAFEIFERHENELGLAETHKEYMQYLIVKEDREGAIDHARQALEHYNSIKATKQAQYLRRQLKKLSSKKSS